MQVREAIKFQYTDWNVAEADEEAAAEARFRSAADVAADSQFICPLEDVLGTLSVDKGSGNEDGIRIFRLQFQRIL